MRTFLPVAFVVAAAGLGLYSHRETVTTVPVVEASVTDKATVVTPPVDERAISRAAEAVELLKTAPDRGLAVTKYNVPGLEATIERLKQGDRGAPDRSEQLATLDRDMRRAVLAFAHDVALGRTSPTAIEPTWKNQRSSQDFSASLDEVGHDSLAHWIDSLEPPHAEYRALKQALKDLRAQDAKGGWPEVPLRLLKPGISDPAVVTLRHRLAASGELQTGDAGDAAYDQDVEAAVRVFQEHHAMKPTGIADRSTLMAMNVPLAARIRQVEMNLERWRWMPDDLGSRHFLVNIPSYLLMLREDGQTVRAIRVVVGKPGRETPIFSGDMETVVFSPYWNVPDSIAEGETAPAIRQDPNYLARNQIDVVRRTKAGARIVNPADINWYDPDETRELSFRQRPGAKNALGHVKFLFPNAFNVYLHDTPADKLFARTSRAFSHGCVRVEEPEALAAYVLRGESEWTAERISAAMNAGVEKYVKLDETIPVHIAYFTTWVDEKNGLYFLPDVYGYDTRQIKLIK